MWQLMQKFNLTYMNHFQPTHIYHRFYSTCYALVHLPPASCRSMLSFFFCKTNKEKHSISILNLLNDIQQSIRYENAITMFYISSQNASESSKPVNPTLYSIKHSLSLSLFNFPFMSFWQIWNHIPCNLSCNLFKIALIHVILFHFSACKAWHYTGKYATQESSGMCHLMPWRHLPEWREEDERAFVHCCLYNLRSSNVVLLFSPIFPQFFLIFFLSLVLQVGGFPNQVGPVYQGWWFFWFI